MSITDEDLQFVADGMWKDALLPDLPDIYGIDVGTDGEPIELPAPGDKRLERNGDGKGSSSRKKATPAAKQAKSKASNASGTSAMTDFYLSSPVDVRPKKNGKMSKSMKGASQNESQRGRLPGPSKSYKPNDIVPELETDNGDPYELPISPKSMHRPQTAVEFDKKSSHKGTSPVAAPKPPSPFGDLIPPSTKKLVKNQKRVAKRSFLDPPSTPLASDTKVTRVQMPPPPKPAIKEVTPAVPATATKPPPRFRAAKKPAAPKKPAKPRETKKKTVSRPPPPVVNEEKIVDEPEDEYRIPDDVPPPVEDITKKLRPRGERVPILISSDVESSDEEEEDAAIVPDTNSAPFTTPVAQMDPPDSIARPSAPSSPKHSKHAVHDTTTPAEREEIDRSIDEYIRKNSAAFKSSKAKGKKKEVMTSGGEESTRGRQDRKASVTDNVLPLGKQDKKNSHHKRQRSPAAAPARHQESKKKRSSDKDRPDATRVESQARKVLQPMAVPKDPFVEDMEVDELQPQKTNFTTRLLQSTAPPVQSAHSQSSQRSDSQRDRQQYRIQDKPQYVQPMPRALPRDHLDGLSHVRAHNESKFKAIDSDGIAREMMKLLTAGAQDPQEKPKSAKDIWLDETDPYKETGQIMSYVCKTVLRFLKSKEAAIEDVAEEYQQRGSAVLDRLDTLHGSERHSLAQNFEQSRQRSLAVFEAAQRDVQLLATRLERVNLVPVIQNVLADNAGSRLRLLQTEIM
ncbi:hypothetical protein Sste5346_004995 [Sporothrix stenoceras]|uniref:Uncharacterized protein n=1 Tax=Sporothrix stenoceras TaxID=5173 RepID=A0ABR3Z5I6_9PEZI